MRNAPVMDNIAERPPLISRLTSGVSPDLWEQPEASFDFYRLQNFLHKVSIRLLEDDNYVQAVDPSRCLLLLHIHVLPSMVVFFKRLLELKFLNTNILIIPKRYSTIAGAEKQIESLGCDIIRSPNEDFDPGWYDQYAEKVLERAVFKAKRKCEAGIDRCILVDDGGLLTDMWWRNKLNRPNLDAISIQQTASGLFSNRLHSEVRRINVARSAAKRFFESKIIVSGVLRKVEQLQVLKDHHKIGIIGLGSLGTKLGLELCANGHKVYTYDHVSTKNVSGSQREESWQECISKADVIFGCTGHNFMHHFPSFINGTKRQKKLISLSSRDVEFQSLLKESTLYEHLVNFDDLKMRTALPLPHVIYNGGFPINFDRQVEWERENEICLTRALVLQGILQALCVKRIHNPNRIEKLAAVAQRELVRTWLEMNKQDCNDYEISEKNFNNLHWWFKASKGQEFVKREH
jgi:hypothetical protein